MSTNEQKEVFLQSEGNEWYITNKTVITAMRSDPVIDIIYERNIKQKTLLEIGYSNGWRLNILSERFKCNCYGMDPSLQAIEEGEIIIYDFEPLFPYRNKYRYVEGLYSYKMDYSKLFLSNPLYFLLSKSIFTHDGLDKIEDPDERVSVSVLKKNLSNAYAY